MYLHTIKCISLSILLAACSGDTKNEDMIPKKPNINENKTTDTTVLNLSLPAENPSYNNEIFIDSKNKLENLFEENEDEKSLSISAKPTLKTGEQLTDMPTINGGKVNIKIKLD